MIILSFLVFMFLIVWMVVSVLAAFIGFAGLESCGSGYAALTMCGGVLSLVCWYQVLVWGKPWFTVLAAAWM